MNEKQDRGYWRRFGAAVKVYCRDNQIERLDTVQKENLRKMWHEQAGIDPMKSHRDFNHSETTKIFRHFDALANPDSFDAQMLDGADADRETLLAGIRRYPPHYVRTIVRGTCGLRFGNFDSLSNDQLRKLRITLTERERAGRVSPMYEEAKA